METKTRKRIYRIATQDRILSEHKTFAAAFAAHGKSVAQAALGVCGLTPETAISVERFNGSTWETV